MQNIAAASTFILYCLLFPATRSNVITNDNNIKCMQNTKTNGMTFQYCL